MALRRTGQAFMHHTHTHRLADTVTDRDRDTQTDRERKTHLARQINNNYTGRT